MNYLKNRPVLSVALITYNHAPFVAKALESILTQNIDFEIEIVVGDDFSTDETLNILEEYASENSSIKIIKRNRNIGPTKNLWETFVNCKGKYIAVLEGDDFWCDNDKLSKQVTLLENNRDDIVAVCHKTKYLSQVDKKCEIFPKIKSKKSIVNASEYLIYKSAGLDFHLSSIVFRNIINSENYKYESLLTSSNYISDFPLKLLLASNGKIEILNETMSTYRLNSSPTSYSKNTNEIKAIEERLMLNGVFEFFCNEQSIIQQIVLYEIIKTYFVTIKEKNLLNGLIYLFSNYKSKYFLSIIRIHVLRIKSKIGIL